MAANLFGRIEEWQLGVLLAKYVNLRISPVAEAPDNLLLSGKIAFRAEKPGWNSRSGEFDLNIEVPIDYPRSLPLVSSRDGRIPKSFHTNPDGTLCLGSATRQKLEIGDSTSLIVFIERCIIPFLYSYMCWEQSGELPFGELPHGNVGLEDDYAELFGVESAVCGVEMVRLASLQRRIANRFPCPCGSGNRLGKCHNRQVNELRSKLGRKWFEQEYQLLSKSSD